MAGTRNPGAIGLSGEPEDLNDGTLTRGQSPLPGPIGAATAKKAIMAIESLLRYHLGFSAPDGRIGVGGKPHQALAAGPTIGTTAPDTSPASMFSFPLAQRPSPDWTGGKRYFGAPRGKGRLHAGCDLLGAPGTEIYAVADGTLVRGPYQFTGPKQKLAVTHAVEIQHPPYLIRYGEIMADSYVGGSKVKRGQLIAKIGDLKMLHFELYTNGASTASLNGPGPHKRRSDVADPAPYLKQWVKNLPGK